MSLNSISIPQCDCAFNNGAISFLSKIEFDKVEDVQYTSLYYYILSPRDESETLFYKLISTKINDRQSTNVNVVGFENREAISDMIHEFGDVEYVVVVKTVEENVPGDTQKEFSRQKIQFKDVITQIDIDGVSTNENTVQVNVFARYFSEKCMRLVLNTDKNDDDIEFSFSYDKELKLWTGNAKFSTTIAECNKEIKIYLNGGYLNSNKCNVLPCRTWKYYKELSENIKGACMNTKYPTGLHILNDQTNNDFSCSVIKTAKSGHLVTSYTAVRTGSLVSGYVRVLSAKGALTTSILVPDVTDNTQRDVDLAPIADSDDFVAVWSSNAIGNAYRIYCRRFTVGTDGRPKALGASIQLSQSNGDYVAPRIVYNKKIDKFLITWISIIEKAVQTVYLNNNEELKPAGYQGSYSNIVSTEYYSSALDLHNSKTLSVSLINAGENIIAAYKLDQNKIAIFKYSFQAGSVPQPVSLPNYSITGVKKFSLAFDEVNSAIKIVFVRNGDNHVFGDTIDYFGRQEAKATPIPLNQANYVCDRPFIKRMPKEDGSRYFAIAWETDKQGSFYNVFDEYYSQMSSEIEVNPGVSSTDKPRLVVTDNQIAVVVDALNMGNQPLSSSGILYYVQNR